ncbi:MAG: hypothetical protein EOL87_06450 [Spartobacteria bacterium]|nr:hypothetical protein [Spartobacteria bacterium]
MPIFRKSTAQAKLKEKEQQSASAGNTGPSGEPGALKDEDGASTVRPLSEEEQAAFTCWLNQQAPPRRPYYLKLAVAYGYRQEMETKPEGTSES